MWSSGIAMVPPIFNENLSLLQDVENPPFKQLIAHLAVEALDRPILQGAVAFNEQGLDL